MPAARSGRDTPNTTAKMYLGAHGGGFGTPKLEMGTGLRQHVARETGHIVLTLKVRSGIVSQTDVMIIEFGC